MIWKQVEWHTLRGIILFGTPTVWAAQAASSTDLPLSPPPRYLSAPRKLPGLAGARVLPHPSSLSERVWLHWGEKRKRKEEGRWRSGKFCSFSRRQKKKKSHKRAKHDEKLRDARPIMMHPAHVGWVVVQEERDGGRAVISPDTTITTGTIQPHQSLPFRFWLVGGVHGRGWVVEGMFRGALRFQSLIKASAVVWPRTRTVWNIFYSRASNKQRSVNKH